MARAKQSSKQPEESLEDAVKEEVNEAADAAEEGNVKTVKQSEGGPAVDLPTGQRSHPTE